MDQLSSSLSRLGLFLTVVVLFAGCSKQQNPSSDGLPVSTQSLGTTAGGGAIIEKPFQQKLAGAECYRGAGKSAGNAGFGFPSRSDRVLAFSLGPLKDGLSPGQENNKAYAGAGTYSNVGISLKSPQGKILAGFGTITVNPDQQTGSFAFADGSARGTWDCGHRL